MKPILFKHLFIYSLILIFLSSNVLATQGIASDKDNKANSAKTIIELPYSESFEDDFGDWEQSLDDDFDWLRGSGTTWTPNTGPDGAYHGSYYLYTDASGNSNSNCGLVASFSFAGSLQPTLRFYYHMNGGTMGELKVQTSIDNGITWNDEWALSGNQGNQWYQQELDLSAYSNLSEVMVRFWGTMGGYYYSDMAIDQVEIFDSYGTPNNLSGSLIDTTGQVNLNWVGNIEPDFQYFNIYRNSTIIGSTTDTAFVDYVTNTGIYAYHVTALNNNVETGPTNSISFEYRAFKITPDSINFGITSLLEPLSLPFTIYNFGDDTLKGYMTIPDHFTINGEDGSLYLFSYLIKPGETQTFEVTFLPIEEILYEEEIIISHSTIGSSTIITLTGEGLFFHSIPFGGTFEPDYMEDWRDSNGADDDWSRNYSSSFGTSTYGTGPSQYIDGFHYMFTEADGNLNETMGIESLFRCGSIGKPFFTFWYHMYGVDMGELKLQASSDGGASWNDEWLMSGNQGNQWYQAEIDLSDYAFEEFISLRFWGTVGNGNKSDMAIDKVRFYNNVEAPENLSATLDSINHQVSLSWQHSSIYNLLYFNVYQNSEIIGTTQNSGYSTILSDFGTYDFEISAVYDMGESAQSNSAIIKHSSLVPENLISNLNDINGEVMLNWEFGKAEPDYSIYDDFDDEVADNWIPLTGEWFFDEEAYTARRWTSKENSSAYFDEDFSDFVYEVKLRNFSNEDNFSGINFNGVPDVSNSLGVWESSYIFVLSQVNSTYGIQWRYWSLYKRFEGDIIQIQDWQISNDVKRWREPNIIKVVCSNGYIDVYINDIYQNTFYDTQFSSGKVGLKMWEYDDDAYTKFDYAKLTKIPDGYKFGKVNQSKERNVYSGEHGILPGLHEAGKVIGKELSPQPPSNEPYIYKADECKAYLNHNIYRNNNLIGTTSDNNLVDYLPNYGLHKYYITALYDEGETEASNTDTVYWPHPEILTDPLYFDKEILQGENTSEILTISDLSGDNLGFSIEIDFISGDGPSLNGISENSSGWLTVDPDSGTIAGNSSIDINVQFNTTGLEPGEYSANIVINNDEKADYIIPVSYIVHPSYVPLEIDLKVFLEGPYHGSLMTTHLNALNYLPNFQPFFGTPWYYPGSESVEPIPNANIVDWVLIEIRETAGDASSATSGKIIDRMAGFLLIDGSIVTTDGSTLPELSIICSQNLYAVIYHRNHIPVMSSQPLNNIGDRYQYDFSSDVNSVFGGGLGHKEVSPGVWSMIAGNADANDNMNNLDKNDVWILQIGNTGYLKGDFDMNGLVDEKDKNNFWEMNTGRSSQFPE